MSNLMLFQSDFSSETPSFLMSKYYSEKCVCWTSYQFLIIASPHAVSTESDRGAMMQ